jgi:hypothetical protein
MGPASQERKKTKSKEMEKGRALLLAARASRARVLCGRLGQFRPSSVRAGFFFPFNCFKIPFYL